jgi:hypothetical protein
MGLKKKKKKELSMKGAIPLTEPSRSAVGVASVHTKKIKLTFPKAIFDDRSYGGGYKDFVKDLTLDEAKQLACELDVAIFQLIAAR